MVEMVKRRILVLLLLTVLVNDVKAQDEDTTEHPGEDCLPFDGSPSPRCGEFVNPDTLEPVFIQHQWNCSRFWICGPDLEHCLFECAPTSDGGNLYFDVRIQYPLGPVCDWPEVIDCNMGTTPTPCNCEPWQECIQGVCTPDCKIDDHCDDDEYCDYTEGGSGECHIGCRNGADCGKCGDCVAHVCTEPECCTDADCATNQSCDVGVCKYECIVDADCDSTEYCDTDHSCQVGCRNGANCGKCGDCVAHVCNEPECCDDSDCEVNQSCELGVCKYECIVDNDCDSTEYCDTDHSCQVGCRDDAGCPGCATCESHVCSTPECCVDADCLDDDKPICEDNICKAGCREHDDCAGYNAVCNVLHDNCKWCNNTDTEIGQCNPGCIDNTNCAPGLECTGNHLCSAIGSTVLKTIILDTQTCSGCSGGKVEAGAWLSLTGEVGADNDFPTCSTLVLDHPDTVDYAAGNTATFDTDNKQDQDIMSTCYKANLHTGITEGKVTWTATAGEWTPSNKQITLRWSDSTLAPLCCCLDRATLTPAAPTAEITVCKRCQDGVPTTC